MSPRTHQGPVPPARAAALLLALGLAAAAQAGGKHADKPWGSFPEEWKEAGTDYFTEWQADYGERWRTVHDSFKGERPRATSSRPLFVDLKEPATIKVVQTMHYNDGKGVRPGKILLLGSDGRVHGPWWTEGLPGPRGEPNVIWQVTPVVELPAGRYQVLDSDPYSWSSNAASQGAGMTRVGTLPPHRPTPKPEKGAGTEFMKGW